MDVKHLLITCLTIGLVNAYSEWSQWTLCTLGCGGGERSRVCQESTSAISNTCKVVKTSEIEYCKKEMCETTGFPSLPATRPPLITQPSDTTSDQWNTIQNCERGCKLTKDRGTVQATFKEDILSTWEFVAKKGHFIQLTFTELSNFDWKNGGLYIAGPDMFEQFKSRKGEVFSSNLPTSYTSKNTMNVTLQNSRLKDSFGEVVLEFKYITYPDYTSINSNTRKPNKEKEDAESSAKGGTNVILIASIAICIGVIIIAVAVIAYRKTRNRGTNKKMGHTEEGIEDCSSIAGSNRSARQNKLTSPRKDRNPGQSKIILPNNGMLMMNPVENERLIVGRQNGYPSDGQEMFIQGQDQTVIPTIMHNGQPYINWPMQLPLINQTHYNYPPNKHMSFEHITQQGNNIPVYYPNSGTEG